MELSIQFSSVTQPCPTFWDSMDCSTPNLTVHHQSTPGVYSNSSSLSWWCYPTISSFVVLFSSLLQFFPASGFFSVSQLFASGGQSIGASASTSVFPMNSQDWFPLGWTAWISLQSRGLTKVFSNTTVQKHQFFDAQPFLWSTSHIHTWLLEKTIPFDYMDLCQQSNVSFFKALSRFVITSLQRS